MSKFYSMLVILRAVKGSLVGLIGELVTVDGKNKMTMWLNMLRCAGADILVEYWR